MQTESVTPSVPEVKKTSAFYFWIVLLVILALAAAGLALWGYTLNNDIKATQSADAALQGKNEELASQADELTNSIGIANTDLEKAKKNLEDAKKELATTQAALTKSKDEETSLHGKIDKALLYLDVEMEYWANPGNLDAVSTKIKLVNDSKLTELFETLRKSGNSQDYLKYAAYIWSTIADALK